MPVSSGATKQKAPAEDYTPSDGEIVPLTASQPTGPSARFKDFGTAVVAGAAGRTGKAIVQRLIQDGVPVRALVRDIANAVRQPAYCPPDGRVHLPHQSAA